ncbi:MAG: maleylpyruvate isomerase N-terminal domain-containing protein [Actinomycetota bacterium]
MGRREELLLAEEQGWRELNDPIDMLSDEQLETPGYAPDGWSVKDMMWHVACWSADCVRAFDQMRAGTFTGVTIDEDAEIVNRRWFEQSQQLDLETVRTEWRSSRTMMVERFTTIGLTPDADEWFEETGPLHYTLHLADLRPWVATLLGQP